MIISKFYMAQTCGFIAERFICKAFIKKYLVKNFKTVCCAKAAHFYAELCDGLIRIQGSIQGVLFSEWIQHGTKLRSQFRMF